MKMLMLRGVVNDTVVTDDEEVGGEEAKKIYELAADFTKKKFT